MYRVFLNKLIGPLGIILVSLIIIILWFGRGLLFGGAEDQLTFYNYTKSLNMYSHIWYAVGTGYPTLPSLPRLAYFMIFQPLYSLGIPNFFLEALTFFILMITGMISVYYLVKITVNNDIKKEWQRLVPFLSALFYFFNPFSLTQIWGRALAYQIFSFALIPSFLLFFVLALQKRSILYCIMGALTSFFLSTSFVSPAVVLTSWASVGVYLVFNIFINRHNNKNIAFATAAFLLLLLLWFILNLFWLYPMIKQGSEMLSYNLSVIDNINSLRGLSPSSRIYNVIRLIHREYYDGTYGVIYQSILFIGISWLLPIFALFAIPILKKSKYFLFFISLFIISIFVCIGANLPTEPIFIWFFKNFPLLQVLRNPYEKFGINLTLAYAPFFAVGLLVLSEKLMEKIRLYFKLAKLKNIFLPLFIFLEFIVLVWPYWKGNFAGGVKTNFWVGIPDYYTETNNWLNAQVGDFNILHLPISPEDGVTYTWNHFYEGIETSEFLFDKSSIARNTGFNKNYYSALLEKFGASADYKILPNWSTDNLDFKEPDLVKELVKINVRYLILHFDTNYKFRQAKSPEETAKYLESQQGIKKVASFEKLDIYKVDIPDNIDLIYSPDNQTNYKKISATSYTVDVKNAKGVVNLYFLQQFHPSWEAYIGLEKITDHKKIFSYANSWSINKTGNYQVLIKFAQQDPVYVGEKIAFSAAAILLLILVGYCLKVRKNLS